MKIEIEGKDLLLAVRSQRDEALDAAANNAAAIQALQRRIAELEAMLMLKAKDGNEHADAAADA